MVVGSSPVAVTIMDNSLKTTYKQSQKYMESDKELDNYQTFICIKYTYANT